MLQPELLGLYDVVWPINAACKPVAPCGAHRNCQAVLLPLISFDLEAFLLSVIYIVGGCHVGKFYLMRTNIIIVIIFIENCLSIVGFATTSYATSNWNSVWFYA